MVDDRTFTVELDKPYAPTFFLYCLTATVGSVVDKQLVLAHEQDGDLGYDWLKTASAGSGPFKLRSWKPNESLIIEGNPDYWRGAAGFERVITRHIAEPATQMLLLEKGDIDIARNLEADQLDSLRDNAEIVRQRGAEGGDLLSRPQPEERVSGQARGPRGAEMADPLRGASPTRSSRARRSCTRRSCREGFLGALDEQPYQLDVEKAKELLRAGRPRGRLQGHDGHPQPIADARTWRR